MAGNTFDAGSIESRLVLDRSDFVQGLRDARLDGERFERQKFTAKVDVDASGVLSTITSIRAELASLRNVNLNVGVTGSNAQIRAIGQSANALNGRQITLGIQVDGLSDVNAQLRTLRQNISALDGRTINIGADFDNAAAMAQIRAMRAELALLDGSTARTSAGFNSAGMAGGFLRKHLADIVAAAMLAAPALFPLTEAALSAAGAFTTMGVAVGAGMALFAAATFGAVQEVGQLNKDLEKAKTNLEQQRDKLTKLTPGTDAYAKQLEKVAEAQQMVNDRQADFSPIQRQTNYEMEGAKQAWKGFIDATRDDTLGVVNIFLRTAAEALPRLVPAVKAISPEFQAIGVSLRGWVNDGGLDRFVNFIIRVGIPAFRNLRLAGSNVATVLGNMFRAFGVEATSLSASIERITGQMARWSNEGGFERFIARVNQQSPQVREFFSALWDALSNIGAALRPLGPLGLGFVTVLLQIVAALPPEWIRAVYLGFIAWRTALLGLMIFNAIKAAILGVRAAMFALSLAFGVTPIGWLLIAIGALVAIFVTVGLKMGWLQKIWKAVWSGIQTAFAATVEFLRGKFGALALLLGPIGAIAWIAANWSKVWGAVKATIKSVGDAAVWLWRNAIKPAFDGISFAARLLVVILGTVLFTPLYLAFKLLRYIVVTTWKSTIKPTWDAMALGARLLYDNGIKPAFGLIMAGFREVARWARWLYQNGIKPGWDSIAGATRALWNGGIKPAFGLVMAGMREVGRWAKWLWNSGIKPGWDAISGGTRTLWNKGVKPSFNFMTGGIKEVGRWGKWLWEKGLRPFWVLIQSGTTRLKNGMVKTFDDMRIGINKAWTAIKKVTAVPINFVIDTVYNNGIVKVWNKIAGAVGLNKMKLGNVGKIKYAHGGAGPVTGGLAGVDSVNAQLMPGEHVWTADEVRNAGGHRAMAAMRAAFSSTGKARIAPSATGRADYARGSGQKFAFGGGIIDWTKDTLSDAATGLRNAWDETGGKALAAGWDKLKDVTRGALAPVGVPLLQSVRRGVRAGVTGVIPGTAPWENLAVGTATKPIDMLINWLRNDDARHAVGGANVQKALAWAKSQEGKPYVWGGVGPHGYDCSGFMSAIQNVIDGKSPFSRRWATGAFPPGAEGWKRNLNAPFKVGITNAGVGHTAGTLAGVNVESRGGEGVVIGKRARGAKDGMFSSQWGYVPSMSAGGSAGRWAETATAVLRELGLYSPSNLSNVLRAIQKESGGDPNAVNNWDSNARMGNPSKGLLQVIKTTFDAFAGKYRGKGQLDPYANIYAAVRYARATYGGGWSARMARPGGYKLGGVTVPGVHMVGEAGPELIATSGGDRVFTATETQRMLNRAGGGAGVTVIQLPDTFIVRIGEHEFRAMLDDETRAVISDVIHEAEGAR
jgi:hypothetical protein